MSDPWTASRRRGWGALLARGLALGRPLAHASDRYPSPQEDGHRAPEDRNLDRRTVPPSKAPPRSPLSRNSTSDSPRSNSNHGQPLHNDVIGDAVHANGLGLYSGTRRPCPTGPTPFGASSPACPEIRAPARPSPYRWRMAGNSYPSTGPTPCHHPERRAISS